MRRKPDTGQPDQAVEATSEIDRFQASAGVMERSITGP
jgi:hypothetical protein